MRAIRLIAWALVGFMAAAVATFLIAGDNIQWSRFFNSRTPAVIALGGPFEVIDTNGKTVTEADLKGKPSLLFFGYTYCPDVCPSTLNDAGTWLEKLGPSADKLQVYFVTVDPERDTKENLKGYMEAFDERIIGLTGTKEQVSSIVKSFKVYVERKDQGDGEYLVNHSASVYLLDSDGQFAGTIKYQAEEKTALAKLRRLIGSS